MELARSYSNRLDLTNKLVTALHQLRRAQDREVETPASVRSTGRSGRPWRVSDRLTDNDVQMLIAAFTDGTSTRTLAQRYGISESSVQRLISKHRLGTPRRRATATTEPHPLGST